MALEDAKSNSVRDVSLLASSSSLQISIRRNGTSDLQLLYTNDSTTQYYVRNSTLRPGIPAVTLFAGETKAQGRVIGVCHFPAFSHSIAVGRGDPTVNPNDVHWETISKISRDHSVYEFSTVDTSGERQSYRWKRTHDPTLKDSNSTKWNMRSWKLEEGSTGQVLAVYAANKIKYGKDAGTIKLVGGRREICGQWILLTYLGISEKARRRAMARRDISWFF